MMIKLNNFRFFKKIFINYLCAMAFITFCCYQKNALSQNNNPQKKSSSNLKYEEIKVVLYEYLAIVYNYLKGRL